MKFDFVDGTIMVPIYPFDWGICAWTHCNILVHSWIMHFILEFIGQSIVFMENTIDIWNDLK